MNPHDILEPVKYSHLAILLEKRTVWRKRLILTTLVASLVGFGMALGAARERKLVDDSCSPPSSKLDAVLMFRGADGKLRCQKRANPYVTRL